MSDRKKFFVANWKMNLSYKDSVALALALKEDLAGVKFPQIVVCPSFTALTGVGEALQDSVISLGAQDVSWLDKGNLTGEVSASMLKELKVKFVIVGHSERRGRLKETEDMVNKKLQAVLRAGLIPILCVGETFAERQQERQNFVITGQVESALKDIALNGKQMLVAYEPVWAIGSDKAVEIEEAEAAARLIKQVVIDLYHDAEIKNNVSVLYGGSVDKDNIAQFAGSKFLAGVLVGGASLEAAETAAMVTEMNDKK